MAMHFRVLQFWMFALLANAEPADEQACPASGCAKAKQEGEDEANALRVSLLQYKADSMAGSMASASSNNGRKAELLAELEAIDAELAVTDDDSHQSVTRQCTNGFPNPNAYTNRQRCTDGNNNPNQGYVYIYNKNRYNPSRSACGTDQCWCCQDQKRECVGWDQVPNTADWKNNKQNCEGGGYQYTYNSNRGQPNAACGEEAQCYCCRVESGPPRRRRGWSPPRRRRQWNPPRRRRGFNPSGGGGNYRISQGYQCQNGYSIIRSQNECQSAAMTVQNNKNLHVDTNVPSSTQNPRGCYIYGNPGQYSNLYYNPMGATSGSWPQRNVICKQGYSSLAQTTDEQAELESKQQQILGELQAIDKELAEIGDAEE